MFRSINMELKFYQPIYNALKKLKLTTSYLDFTKITKKAEEIYQELRNTNEALIVKYWFENIKDLNNEMWYSN